MVLGALVGGIFLFGLGSLTSLVWITVFWVVIQVALNALQGPLTAITPDRFPRRSAAAPAPWSGIGTQVGMTRRHHDRRAPSRRTFGVGYSIFGVAVIVVTAAVRAHQPRLVVEGRRRRSRGAGARSSRGFWINPRKHPDFAWAFAARFLLILGYFVVSTYQLYILHRLHRSVAAPKRRAPSSH